MTKEQIEKIVAEKLEAKVNKLVEEALAAREAEVLGLLALSPRRRGFLSKIVQKRRQETGNEKEK